MYDSKVLFSEFFLWHAKTHLETDLVSYALTVGVKEIGGTVSMRNIFDDFKEVYKQELFWFNRKWQQKFSLPHLKEIQKQFSLYHRILMSELYREIFYLNEQTVRQLRLIFNFINHVLAMVTSQQGLAIQNYS